ncbi:MAG TPA: hypothetical protein V6D20_15310 [Candidatus Obscuribacterales bacterium]
MKPHLWFFLMASTLLTLVIPDAMVLLPERAIAQEALSSDTAHLDEANRLLEQGIQQYYVSQ